MQDFEYPESLNTLGIFEEGQSTPSLKFTGILLGRICAVLGSIFRRTSTATYSGDSRLEHPPSVYTRLFFYMQCMGSADYHQCGDPLTLSAAAEPTDVLAAYRDNQAGVSGTYLEQSSWPGDASAVSARFGQLESAAGH